MTTNERFVVLDFEASSLSGNSYPIEVAWGNTAQGVKSYLINPITVMSWTDWSWHAEENIHHISKSMLWQDGANPFTVFSLLEEVFNQFTVYSDAPDFDQHWLDRFSDLPNCSTEGMKIRPISSLIGNILFKRGLGDIDPSAVLTMAEKKQPSTHRAAADVRTLLLAVELATKANLF